MHHSKTENKYFTKVTNISILTHYVSIFDIKQIKRTKIINYNWDEILVTQIRNGIKPKTSEISRTIPYIIRTRLPLIKRSPIKTVWIGVNILTGKETLSYFSILSCMCFKQRSVFPTTLRYKSPFSLLFPPKRLLNSQLNTLIFADFNNFSSYFNIFIPHSPFLALLIKPSYIRICLLAFFDTDPFRRIQNYQLGSFHFQQIFFNYLFGVVVDIIYYKTVLYKNLFGRVFDTNPFRRIQNY